MIEKRDIEKLFKRLLSEISDRDLREKVAETWVVACRAGGWNDMGDLEKIPFTILTDCKGISLIDHTIAVTQGALGLARAQVETYKNMPYRINFDFLIAGGLLHDVGKLLEIEPHEKGGYRESQRGRYVRHPISGAVMAAKIGLPPEIVNSIACHSKEGEGRPQTVETVFIHQADFSTFDPLVMQKRGLLIE